jgi:predicted ABC-type ATPase
MNHAVPQLLIIAGPNGAGKSTFSKDLSNEGSIIFDADKEIAVIDAKYPGLPSQSVFHALQQVFLDQIDEALKQRANFTIESNFRDNSLMGTIVRFQDSGYEVNMVYLLLNGVPQSMDRVKQRVKNGGHFISDQDIIYNYHEGLKNLIFFAGRFDNLEVIDSSGSPSQLRSLLSIQSGVIKYRASSLPAWADPTINEIAIQFDRGRGQQPDQNEAPRRPRR